MYRLYIHAGKQYTQVYTIICNVDDFFYYLFYILAGDWLQGPYVYFLYTQYGFSKGEIGRLFIAGFGSSMIFGTFVGSLADK